MLEPASTVPQWRTLSSHLCALPLKGNTIWLSNDFYVCVCVFNGSSLLLQNMDCYYGEKNGFQRYFLEYNDENNHQCSVTVFLSFIIGNI